MPEYRSSWKSKFWEVDPESGKHDYKLAPKKPPELYENIFSMLNGYDEYIKAKNDKYRLYICQKCGSKIETYSPDKPLSGWGPHCLEEILKSVID